MEILSKYIEDKRFIQWVFNPTNELEKWWEAFETDNPKEKQNIRLARNVLLKLKTNNKNLSEEDKILIFSRILKQIEEQQGTHKRNRFLMGMLKYAAVAIMFFAIGALLFYERDNFNPQFYSQNMAEPIADNEAKLIRPDGENILLEEKKTVIEYTQTGQVKVNNNLLELINPIKKGTPELNQLVIPYGKTSEILLPDGTRVYLNAGSRLVYPEFFNDKNREVFLVGEAFFEVIEDKTHPFVVQTTDLRIKVLGTKFNVSAYPSENVIETVLTEGKVRLEQNNSGLFSLTTDLLPNQLAAFYKVSGEVKLQNVNVDNYTLWKDGVFKFESTDLNRVVKRLERYYNIRFKYADPLTGTVKISGKLDLEENREEIINRVATVAAVKIVKRGEYLYEIE